MENTKITNKEIAEYIGKSLDTVNGWKQRQPKLLEAVRTGIYCNKNKINIDMIKNCIQLKKLARDNDE